LWFGRALKLFGDNFYFLSPLANYYLFIQLVTLILKQLQERIWVWEVSKNLRLQALLALAEHMANVDNLQHKDGKLHPSKATLVDESYILELHMINLHQQGATYKLQN
jgi:hypothetical protein